MMDSSVSSTPSAIEQPDHDSNLLVGLVGGGVAMLVLFVLLAIALVVLAGILLVRRWWGPRKL